MNTNSPALFGYSEVFFHVIGQIVEVVDIVPSALGKRFINSLKWFQF